MDKQKQKQKLLRLRDTHGNFTLAIKLPTKDYKPKDSHGRAQKQVKSIIKPRNRKKVDNRKRKRKHPLTKSEINRRYRERHPDRDKQQKRNWVLNNMEYVRQKQRERRANMPPDMKEQYRKRHAEQEAARRKRIKANSLLK